MCTNLTPEQRAATDQRYADAEHELETLFACIVDHREYCPDCRPEACCQTLGQAATYGLIQLLRERGDLVMPFLATAMRKYADARQQVGVPA